MTENYRTDLHHGVLQLERTEPKGDALPDDFKAVFRNHPAGVTVVTTTGPDGPVGFTATSVASVSVSPDVLVFSLAAGSSLRPVIEQARSVAVNFLADDQREVAETFARRGIDRFAEVAWGYLPTGEPILHGVAAWVIGQIDQRIPVGDSLLITVNAASSQRREDARPLVYVDRIYHRLSDHTRTS